MNHWEKTLTSIVGRGDVKLVVEDTLNITLVEGDRELFHVTDVDRLVAALLAAKEIVKAQERAS